MAWPGQDTAGGEGGSVFFMPSVPLQNIETQEQLREALESLRQNQETINSLRRRLATEPNRNSVREVSSQGAQGHFPKQ